MNELDPQLKRLLKWTYVASQSRPVEVPFGFSGRVLARTRQVLPASLLQGLQQTALVLACVSLALIAFGAILLASQRSAPAPTAELPSALSFLASSFTP